MQQVHVISNVMITVLIGYYLLLLVIKEMKSRIIIYQRIIFYFLNSIMVK